MRHEIRLQGYAFSLRPIELTDAPLIVSLRSDPDRTRFVHRVPLDTAAQEAYLASYFERDGDYYFVVERNGADQGAAEGLIALYNLDPERRRAEWGRWVLRSGSLAAVESAWLIYRVGFDHLDLEQVYCHTVALNASVLSFHDKVGLARARRLEAFVELDGERHDVIEHVLDRAMWPDTSARLEDRAKRLASRLLASR
jgi:RimJ/RimL family protein N-acetyltransferase